MHKLKEKGRNITREERKEQPRNMKARKEERKKGSHTVPWM
jgi:hypothetical protein